MAKSEIKRPDSLTEILIAPCGMDCGLCSGYLRAKKNCPGCNGGDADKPSYCITCRIAHCEELAASGTRFCGTCGQFPCKRLKQLDKRYRGKYGMSMIENLGIIREIGLDGFIEREKTRWTCPECGRLICVHKPCCLACGYVWNKAQGDAKEGNHAG
ncbi:DUF3795 domain-containing protein [Candidatus Bipolaricaulota bacterium]|nr:DUF3795 domain-containing protein [Candidatus Bipolaricaulota bacterium]